MSLQAALQNVSRVKTARHVHGAGQACTSIMGGATMSVQKTMSPVTNSWSAHYKVSPLCMHVDTVYQKTPVLLVCRALATFLALNVNGYKWKISLKKINNPFQTSHLHFSF